MKTPYAPTATVLIAVLVKKDLLEMVQSVKVIENLFKSLFFKYDRHHKPYDHGIDRSFPRIKMF